MGDGALASGARSFGAGHIVLRAVKFCSGEPGTEIEYLAYHLAAVSTDLGCKARIQAARLKSHVQSLPRLTAAASPRLKGDAQPEDGNSTKFWPPNAWPKPLKLVTAAALSAAISTAAVAPLEQLRLKLIVGTYGRTIPEVVARTLALHGPAGFFKGNMMSVVRTVPSKGVQFAAYDMSRKALSRRNPETGTHEASPLATTLAGSFAGVTSTVTCHPLEMLQTRLVCSPVGTYAGARDLVSTLLRNEGPRALFGGLGASLVGVIPFTGLNFLVYDGLRWTYCRATGAARCPNNVTLGAGAVAAVTAATATFPLETVRRRMMMGAKYKHTLDALATIYRAEGAAALFAGCTINWIRMIPASGLQVYFYELAKERLEV